jgi:hypothetical protein
MTSPVPWDPTDLFDQNVELEAQRTQTSGLIASHPVSIWVTRNTYVSDGAGGKTSVAKTAELPVVVRLDSTSRFATTATGGRSILTQYQIIAEWDADLQRGDHFQINGRTYIIDDLDNSSGYQLRGAVRGAD